MIQPNLEPTLGRLRTLLPELREGWHVDSHKLTPTPATPVRTVIEAGRRR